VWTLWRYTEQILLASPQISLPSESLISDEVMEEITTLDSPLVYMFKSWGPNFHTADWSSGRHLICFIILWPFLCIDVRDLVYCLDLWAELSPSIVF
jgi:hypothetical protein